MKNRIIVLAIFCLALTGFSSYADDPAKVDSAEIVQSFDKEKESDLEKNPADVSYAKKIAGFIAKSLLIGASEGLSYTAYTACGGGIGGNAAAIATNAVALTCIKICEQYKQGNLTIVQAAKSTIPHELWSSSSYFSKNFIASSLLAACSLMQACPLYTGIPAGYFVPVSLAIKACLFEKPLQESVTYNMSAHIIDIAPKPDVSNIV